MYIPAVLTDNAGLAPKVVDTRKRLPFKKALAALRSRTRQMTKAEVQRQDRMFFRALQDSTQNIGVHNFQGLNAGHLLLQK